ncbi:retinoblastoma-like protein 1 [Lineus longissimus]|uniref:retinoblastoma-like protein 1 n=1 Tax=Lineus longissimus TaxID=88925 RepID=UPI002B4CDDC9
MGLSDDGDENIEQRFEELCLDLNMDKSAKDEAWQAFERISTNYTLEGDGIHWLACALYVACRKTVNPTVSGAGVIEGNCVSLTRLLRSAKLSLIQFFSKMKKWSDMANLPQTFRDKVDRLERNFAVSTVIFKKFEPIFIDMFKDPADDPPKQARSRKQRRLPCVVSDVFTFCWTMFVQVKGNFPAISDDLVNSYHLLLCCIDWFYSNAILTNRKDIINRSYPGIPEGFFNKENKPILEPPCNIDLMCDRHEGLVLEAKQIKEHWWKPYVKKLFERKILKGKAETLSGVLEVGNFEASSKAINSEYEEYVLSVGDFDERIFLGEDASTEIGTPAKSPSTALEGQNTEQNMQQYLDQTKTLAPSTPLTGRRYLKEKDLSITPVSTATQSVSRLQTLLSGRKTSPSDTLIEIFENACAVNPMEGIVERVKEMGEMFCNAFEQPSEGHPGSHIDFAKKRLQLGESLYYKILENIMVKEKERAKDKDKLDFSSLLDKDVFHKSLFACCLEIVIFSYNSQRSFPWIVEIFELNSFHFYKVIELIIRAEDGLSRDVVKHLNHIEETILEGLAWRYESPLWDTIQSQGGTVPTCEDVTPNNQIDKDAGQAAGQQTIMASPLHPALRRVAGEGRATLVRKDLTLSPTAADRFSSPTPGTIKRRLFGPATTTTAGLETQVSSGASTTIITSPRVGSQNVLTFQQTTSKDGKSILIPVQLLPQSPSGGIRVTPVSSPQPQQLARQQSQASTVSNKPKKTGSLALFFRKVYHLASVRLRDLCEHLDINSELRSKIWTCFEHCLVHDIDMMMDRNIDQLIMCAIYVMSKVTGNDKPFQEIMKCYRLQPQAQSHVYRSVLLTSRKRRTSGSTSGSASPVSEDKEEKEKKRADRLSTIRSTSTLPLPHSGSQPPTPTKLSGTGMSFEYEDRGDLIKFYNTVFVKKIKGFALKFSVQNQDKGECPMLSPLPMVRSLTTSPRKVSSNHSIYISPIKNIHTPLTPTSKMLYCFNRSPAKDLRAINNMIKLGERKSTAKRLLRGDDESEMSAAKRLRPGESPVIQCKLVTLQNERHGSNGLN